MDPAEREAVKERAAAFKRLHEERADALAEKEWQRAIAGVEAAFKTSIKTAYFVAAKASLEEAQAAIDDRVERRHVREAGRDPEQRN